MDAMFIDFPETFSIGYVRSIVMRFYKGSTVLNPVINIKKIIVKKMVLQQQNKKNLKKFLPPFVGRYFDIINSNFY